MKATLRLLSVGLTCCALAACGGSSGGSDRQQITSLFNGMYSALAHGDYATTCGDLSQRQQSNVIAAAGRLGVKVSSCTDALSGLFKQAGISRAQVAQAFGAGGTKRQLNSIAVHDNQATVTFTETTQGQTYVETDALVRQGGKWRADRIIKRSQSG